MIRLLSIGVAATLTVAGMLAPVSRPANAAEGTIRKQYAESIERNAVHGSDAPETAAVEVSFFFSTAELL